ncbi:MAG: Asp-tRNA(Asn)/Glu-tRNA(Gln) amidotransferase subunit GatC [Oscillospiraceae bacterium]|nr:Asp-tRNA(Asn)/Glu-tRNA(Gln) amidotransferase subunit GatC [Oscillospiraceae bacterium]
MKFDLENIANLSMLYPDGFDRDKILKKMESIIKMVEVLPGVDIKNSDNISGNEVILREDIIEPSLSRDEVLKNAPSVQGGCILVSKVID